ncbi:hypothetical protein [Microcoleus sp. D2_18a_B4]
MTSNGKIVGGAIALAVKFTKRWCDISNAAPQKRLNLKRTSKP